MAESKNFDIVGVFLSDYGMTGENVALQIFSNLDFSSLQNGLLVCETWNQFLTKDRTLWLKMLEKTQASLEYLSNELSNGDESERKVWKEFFESLKTKEDIKFDKISKLFAKILIMFGVIQEWGDENHCEVEGYYLPEGFKDDLFTFTSQFKVTDCKNLTAEIRLQYNNSFFQKIDEYLGAIEYGKTKKEAWEDSRDSDSDDSDSDDEYDVILETNIKISDAGIRQGKSELLQRIKTEIVNSVM